MKEVILAVPTAELHVCPMVKGKLQAIEDTVLVTEKAVVAKLNSEHAPLILLGSFYTFNMHYTDGCKNFYSSFETVFFSSKINQRGKPGLLLHVAHVTCIYPKLFHAYTSSHTFVCLLFPCSVCCCTCIC